MPDPSRERGTARSPEVVLGIDFGMRRIGLATGNTLTGTAHPLETLRHDGQPFDQLARVIDTWRPSRIVVGLPLTASGDESETTRSARRFAQALGEAHPDLPIDLHDERYSTRAADARFVEARREGKARRRDARNLDSVAAAVIVESWLADRAAGAGS
jgi:putative Holliday junction resolvase